MPRDNEFKFSCGGCGAKCCCSNVEMSYVDFIVIADFINNRLDRFGPFLKDKQVWFTSDGKLADAPLPAADESETRVCYQNSLDTFATQVRANDMKCIFLTDAKTCFLEDIALSDGLDRWFAKPVHCIAFPLVIRDADTPEGWSYVPLLRTKDVRLEEEVYRRYAKQSACKGMAETKDKVAIRNINDTLHQLVISRRERAINIIERSRAKSVLPGATKSIFRRVASLAFRAAKICLKKIRY